MARDQTGVKIVTAAGRRADIKVDRLATVEVFHGAGVRRTTERVDKHNCMESSKNCYPTTVHLFHFNTCPLERGL